jgi:acylphosphatase
MDKQQRTVRFSGMVQGVGFRYTACRIAGRYDVTGYVKNLHDGSVE